MPAHKRSAHDMDATATADHPHPAAAAADRRRRASPDPPKSDSEGSPASSEGGVEEFVLVKLADIRKEVQCPICLGIIRKTRTVMECLHRFCRECIDKSMRLGNNECPACRTHCASRRSLRDDPNYDTLIAILYPDIDKYEEEELAFHEDEKNRNKQIQASIAQTLRRQNEALGRRRSVRRSQGSYRNSHGQNSYLRGRNRTVRDIGVRSDDDVDDANDQDAGKDSSSADERSPDIKQRKRRRWSSNRFSSATSVDGVHDENDEAGRLRDSASASPVRGGTPEVLVWGRGGTRSHTRYGSLSGSNGKNSRSSRLGKLLEHLRNLDDNEDELDVHLTLLPLDGQKIPTLERSNLCCRPSLSIRLLCQFISLQIHVQPEDLEILMKTTKDQETNEMDQSAAHSSEDVSEHSKYDPNQGENRMQVLNGDDTLSRLLSSAASSQGDLVLVYRPKLPT